MSLERTSTGKLKTSHMIMINIGTVALSVLGVFGYMQWQHQQEKLAELSAMVTQLQAAPAPAATTAPVAVASAQPSPLMAEQPIAEQDEIVTRSAGLDLASVVDLASNAGATSPAVDASVDLERLRNGQRLETLAVIDAGVQNLVDAVLAGDYDIHTNYEDEHFSGRIHFAFIGQEEDQEDLENYIAAAAEAGIIAHSSSVVDADGSINGHIMLFDLVERSMENGTLAEQRAVQRMQQQAVALLAADVDVGEDLDAEGRQYYVVEQGDSLAYIALQFYGNTNGYQVIFNANRDQISSPERIRVGQRLLIPSAT